MPGLVCGVVVPVLLDVPPSLPEKILPVIFTHEAHTKLYPPLYLIMYQLTLELLALAFNNTVRLTLAPNVVDRLKPVPAPSLLLRAAVVLPVTAEYSTLLTKSDLM